MNTEIAKTLQALGLDRNPEHWRERLDKIGDGEVERAFAPVSGC